ncbi:MAG: RIP metalloprotease RseP [Aerococcus sp.]|nr:RIP metalloprotease RseP [Aerococcus sp.]
MKAIIIFILIFGVLVTFHEFGHFIMAKRAGIFVREFSIGMGPLIFHYQGQETTYSLRLLPMGGYVRMAGLEENNDYFEPGRPVSAVLDDEGAIRFLSFMEEANLEEGLPLEVVAGDMEKDFYLEAIPYGENEAKRFAISRSAVIEEEDGTQVKVAPIDRQFQNASLKDRLLTNLAGPFNNFVLAVVVYILIAFMQGGVYSDAPTVGEIVADSPAASAGLMAGDTIQQIGATSIASFTDIQAALQQSGTKKVDVQVKRTNGEVKTLTLTPKEEQDQSGNKRLILGIMRSKDQRFTSKIMYGFTSIWGIVTGIFGVIGHMLRTGFNINNFGGPVYMYQATSEVVSFGASAVLSLMAYLSVNLGVVNLLPIPALDGGKVLLNLVEGIRKKPLSAKTEGMINMIGAVLLVLLFIAVTWNDIMRLF